jgi:hypothetical protein
MSLTDGSFGITNPLIDIPNLLYGGLTYNSSWILLNHYLNYFRRSISMVSLFRYLKDSQGHNKETHSL